MEEHSDYQKEINYLTDLKMVVRALLDRYHTLQLRSVGVAGNLVAFPSNLGQKISELGGKDLEEKLLQMLEESQTALEKLAKRKRESLHKLNIIHSLEFFVPCEKF